jgi:hypothetical protein
MLPRMAARSASDALARTGTVTCAMPLALHAEPCSTPSRSPACTA